MPPIAIPYLYIPGKDIIVGSMAEFKSLVINTNSNTKNITKSISIHNDYQDVHF